MVPEGRKRIVVLSQVLPVSSNIGYEDMKYLVVTNDQRPADQQPR